MPWSEIKQMPHSAVELYFEKLPKHQAVLRMMLGEAAKLPHMEEDAQHEWINQVEEAMHEGKRPVKIAPIELLHAIGIGIRK